MLSEELNIEAEDLYSSDEEVIEKPTEYWCADCGIETRYEECPVCGKPTTEGVPLESTGAKTARHQLFIRQTRSIRASVQSAGRKQNT